MDLKDLKKYECIMECCIHLSNFNTRVNGFNQMNTMVRRHTDENFAEALVEAQLVGGRAGLELYFELVRDPHRGLRGSGVFSGGVEVVEENPVDM